MALLDRLTLLIDADGSRAVNELDRVARKTDESLAIGAKAGITLSAVAAFGVIAARAAEEDARAQFVLAKTLETTTAATQDQVGAVETWIASTSRAVGVADDELRPAMATLLRSTNDVTAAQHLLSLALDISAGTGRDVGTVSIALSKAWEGQTTALGRLLPEVGGLVREGASTKDVFDELETTFGGTAKEASQTAGSFQRMNVAFKEIKESIGTVLLPAVEGLAGPLQKLQDLMATDFGKKGLFKIINDSTTRGSIDDVKDAIARMSGEVDSIDASQIAPLKTYLMEAAQGGGALGRALQNMGYGFSGFNKSVGVTTSTVLGFEASLKASAAAASSFLSSIFSVSTAEDKFANAIDDTTATTGGATRATRDLIAEQFNLERSARSVLQAEMDLLDAEKNLEDVRKGASEREKQRASLDVRTAQGRVAQAQQRIADATNELNRASGRRGSSAEAAKARQALADALLEEERARMDLTDTEERANETQRRGTAGSKDLADATKKVEDAQWALKEAIESQRQTAMQDQGDGGPVGRSVRQQRDAFREAATAATGVITAMVEAGAPTDVINGKIAEMVLKLQDAGAAAGVTKSEIKDAADLLIAFGAVAQAERTRSLTAIYGFGATTLTEELDAMRRQGIYIPDIAYRLAAGRAGGGSVNAGRSYPVGERGPEVLTMGNSPGWITPNSSGGNHFHFGTVLAEKVNLERLFTDALDSARRRGFSTN